MTAFFNRNELLTTWRRGLFYVWVVAAIVAAAAAMIGGPLVATDGVDGTKWVALVSPAAISVFVVTGIAWLALLTIPHRSKYLHQPPE